MRTFRFEISSPQGEQIIANYVSSEDGSPTLSEDDIVSSFSPFVGQAVSALTSDLQAFVLETLGLENCTRMPLDCVLVSAEEV